MFYTWNLINKCLFHFYWCIHGSFGLISLITLCRVVKVIICEEISYLIRNVWRLFDIGVTGRCSTTKILSRGLIFCNKTSVYDRKSAWVYSHLHSCFSVIEVHVIKIFQYFQSMTKNPQRQPSSVLELSGIQTCLLT